MSILVNKQAALIFAKIAPIVGGFLFISALQVDSDGVWTTLWRISLSAALGIFITLVGLLYKNIQHHEDQQDAAIHDLVEKLENYIPRREYDQRHQSMTESLGRIESILMGKRR